MLWNFGGGNDGSQPFGALVLDDAGNLYGTTSSGGEYGYGAAFELMRSESGWIERTLYNFRLGADGGVPYAGLTFDGFGNLYGVASIGGRNEGGTVFELTPSGDNWIFQVLYPLKGGPEAALAIDSAGNLYGTTALGGLYGNGTVFKLAPSEGNWMYTTLHDFAGGPDGSFPIGSVIFDRNGNIFGTTDDSGGASPCLFGLGCGVIFEIAHAD